jgi:hypothetical protein
MIRIHDIATGEVVDREMTAAEAAEHAKSEAKFLADEQAKAGKEAARAALLERLGMTADEAALLLG